jgi:hypothetical protein
MRAVVCRTSAGESGRPMWIACDHQTLTADDCSTKPPLRLPESDRLQDRDQRVTISPQPVRQRVAPRSVMSTRLAPVVRPEAAESLQASKTGESEPNGIPQAIYPVVHAGDVRATRAGPPH